MARLNAGPFCWCSPTSLDFVPTGLLSQLESASPTLKRGATAIPELLWSFRHLRKVATPWGRVDLSGSALGYSDSGIALANDAPTARVGTSQQTLG